MAVNGHVTYQIQRSSDDAWVTIIPGTESNNSNKHSGSQMTVSENHPWPPPSGSGLVDIGGPFYTQRSKGSYPRGRMTREFKRGLPPGDTYKAERYLLSTQYGIPIGSTPQWPPLNASTDVEMRTAGATAISRCKPTSSGAEASTAVGELYREGVPHATGYHTWRDRTLSAKNAGSEYLNVKFGWQPLVSEILNFGSTVTRSRDILQQYRADKGRVVRRSYDFPPIRETTHEDQGLVFPATGASISAPWIPPSSQGHLTKSSFESRTRWFSGAFVYGFPQESTPFGNVRELGAEADKLFGISLTPDVLWNLAPWSWAADWFSNTGDVLSTIGDMMSQGLVMKYGYMMEKYSHRISYSLTGATINGAPAEPPAAYFEVTSKTRTVASPFGFGVTWDGLSTAQGAILAALGMSRRG